MKGIIYTRVSSDEQIDGTSLASQDDLCRQYCAQKGIAAVAMFREEGQTAKDLSLNNRSQFLAALEFCRTNKDIAAFVVFRVDRFARNTEDHFAVRRILRTYGTTLHSVTEPIGDKPAEKFIETVLAGAAEYDNAIRKQRCTDGMVARINQGIWPFKPPAGYASAHHRQRGEKKTVPDEPDPAVFSILQRGLRGFASGEIGSQALLVRQLNLWGFASVYGKPATSQLADRILGRNLRFYSGLLRNPWTDEDRPGLHKPMISSVEAASIRLRRLGIAPGTPIKRMRTNPAFPLRGILRCSHCRRRLTAATSIGHGGAYGYYYCVNKVCPARSKGLRSSMLHGAFAAYLQRLSPTPSALSVLQQQLRVLWHDKHNLAEDELRRRQQKFEELGARRRRICDMREDGTYDADEFRDRLKVIDAEIEVLRGLVPLTKPALSIDQILACTRSFLGGLVHLWLALPETARSRFERLIFPEGIFYDRVLGFRTSKLGLILGLVTGAVDTKSVAVHLNGFSSNQLQEYFADLLALTGELEACDTLTHGKAA